MPLHAEAWQRTATAHQLTVSRRQIYEWEGESGTVTARTLLVRHHRPPTPQAIRALLDEKERRFTRLAARLRVDARLARLIHQLAREGSRLALVTGTSSREVARLVPKRLLGRFCVVVTGDRVRRGKPHPEPYRRAFKALNIAPKDALIVENAPYGLRAARRSRARIVIGLTSSLPKRFLHEADLIVSSIPQLCATLRAWTASD